MYFLRFLQQTLIFIILCTFALAVQVRFAGATNKHCLTCCSHALGVQEFSDPELESWVSFQTEKSLRYLFKNLQVKGAKRGFVIASPSTENTDYNYHWVRDASLVMLILLDLYEVTQHPTFLKYVLDFVQFSIENQEATTIAGYGEPKFNKNGEAYLKEWGRPQNDGPALRSLVVTRLAKILLRKRQSSYVFKKLYTNRSTEKALLQKDLEYILTEWKQPSFDLWEEVKGQHFYTLKVSRQALLGGASLAMDVEDYAAGNKLLMEAERVLHELRRHWNSRKQFIESARFQEPEPMHYNRQGLDVSALLAVLHARPKRDEFHIDDPRIEATVEKLENEFKNLYPVNKWGVGTAIGRYPEDKYYNGNPWVLATLAFAEYFYLKAYNAAHLEQDKNKASLLVSRGDLFLERVRLHSNPDGSLSEQIDKNSGTMLGVPHLTWNYAAFLSTILARSKVKL